MTITEHKRLVAAIPEDLREGEEIEVRTSDGEWRREKFALYFSPKRECEYFHGVMDMDGVVWPYARRPAAATKKETVSEHCRRTREQDCHICDDMSCGDNMNRHSAAQKKRLKDEPWPKGYKWRAVDANGWARYFSFEPSLGKKGWYVMGMSQPYASSGYDSTDWQNSLERRPE